MAESSNGVNWSYLNKDALPDVGPWVDPKDRGIWAPDVFRDDKGNYVMYCKSHQLSLPVSGSLASTIPIVQLLGYGLIWRLEVANY